MVRWNKVWADLWKNKTRTLLAALSIAVGVFAVGLITSTFIVIKQDMARDYEAIHPHAAIIFCQDFDEDMLTGLDEVPGVTAVEGRYNLWVKIAGPGERKYRINLNSIGPLEEIRVDQLVFQRGETDLGYKEIILERQGAEGLGVEPGDSVDLITNSGEIRTLKVIGTVHDVHANPFKFTSSTAGFVTPKTMEWLGGSSQFNSVLISISGPQTDAAYIRAIAEKVAVRIERSGHAVYNININNPGQHPAQSVINTVQALMGALGVMSVFLSVFLIINTTTALMGQQIRQIGVLKAIGATTLQLMGIYMALVLAFGFLALLIAVPLAGLAAAGLSRWLIGMLNADPSPFSVPPLTLYVQAAIALGVPLLAALFPVLGGARLTVRQAISTYGLDQRGSRTLFDRLLAALPFVPRPLLLSLRNTFNRKTRLAFTLVTLVLGGAIFISVLSVRDSIGVEIERTFGYYQSDINVEFAEPTIMARAMEAIAGIPGVTAVEGWNIMNANVMRPDDENSDLISLFAPPSNTKLVHPYLAEGRWLLPDDTNAIVVDNHFMKIRPDVKVGDEILLRINGKDHPFVVVGMFRLASNVASPFTFVNNDYLVEKIGGANKVTSLRVVTSRHDPAFQTTVYKALQARFDEEHLKVTMQTGNEAIATGRRQIDILIYLLLVMAVLIALVGGLGLTGTMSMNVLERTREIGVLRSIGAESGVIFQMVVVEGLLIGLMSWVLAVPVAIPLTRLLDNGLGSALMTLPLTYMLSGDGILAWLVIVLILSTIASLVPARGAVRLTIRDVLAYE
jgi:putative ABC transport system permease protein